MSTQFSATHTGSPIRSSGTVVRIIRDYGFIQDDDSPSDGDVYFKSAWFQEIPPLRQGERVTYELVRRGEKRTAHNIERDGPAPKWNPEPRSYWLKDWAYLGHLPETLNTLRAFALPEDWEFKNQSADADHPAPILHSYLTHTFGRLILEKKVAISSDRSVAAINTGLVDPRYEQIFALFTPNNMQPWRLASFCVSGEGPDGQTLVRNFAHLPEAPHYFDDPTELIYNTKAGKPEMAWNHVVLDRIDRYPPEFVEDHWPPSFEPRDTSEMSKEEWESYYKSLGQAIENDSRTYRRIMNRIKDAIDLSVKRVSWNYKTAIPTYYPRVQRLQLLLPICLLSDDVVDLALAVEKTDAGGYLGHTVLPLDWAYRNARLVCRPDSDWLAPNEISSSSDDEDDE